MCQPTNVIATVVNDLLDVRQMIEELYNEETALVDKIKEFMGDETLMIVNNHRVTYSEVSTRRVDTNALKKLLGVDALEPYTKTVVTRRFKID